MIEPLTKQELEELEHQAKEEAQKFFGHNFIYVEQRKLILGISWVNLIAMCDIVALTVRNMGV